MRCRLFDIDLIINRALVYGALTAVLAGLYSASIRLFQTLFSALTGEKSDVTLVITTLLIAAAFTPVRNHLQCVVDRRFAEAHDPLKGLALLGDQMRSVIQALDAEKATRRLLDVAAAAFGADSGALYLIDGGEVHVVQTLGDCRDEAELIIPIEYNDATVAVIALGSLQKRMPYSPKARAVLQETASLVVQACQLAERNGRRG